MHIDEINKLLIVGSLAVQVHEAERAVRSARFTLDESYISFKETEGIDYVKEGTDEWDAMLLATKSEHDILRRAKSDLRNVKRKLDRAILRKV